MTSILLCLYFILFCKDISSSLPLLFLLINSFFSFFFLIGELSFDYLLLKILMVDSDLLCIFELKSTLVVY
jgi:hypothetical protein